MKTIKIGLLCALVLSATTACKKGGVFCYKADGNIVTEERDLSGFSRVSLEMSADVYLEQSPTYSVKIETSKNLLEIIETEVTGSTLEIDLEKRRCIKNNHQTKIYISAPTFKELSISGSGDVYVNGQLETPNFDLSISGSGNVEMDSLDVDVLDVRISGSGDVRIDAQDTMDAQYISISGSGDINALKAPTKMADISIAGSGDCRVNVLDELTVSISGSGDVRYLGNPLVSQQISGSGSVNPY